jgi:hypothetical protein
VLNADPRLKSVDSVTVTVPDEWTVVVTDNETGKIITYKFGDSEYITLGPAAKAEKSACSTPTPV